MTAGLLAHIIMSLLTAYICTHNNIQMLQFLLATKTLNPDTGDFLVSKPIVFYKMFALVFVKSFFFWPIILYALAFAKGVEEEIIEEAEI